jgi:hypothetical protein
MFFQKSINLREIASISFFIVITFFFAFFAEAATLSVSPGTGVYTAGQTFSVKIVVNTSGAAINAADGTLKFNPSEVSVVSLSKGSIFSLWTADPSFSNSAGTISFSGGSPTGYTGAAGTVLTATMRAKAAGSPKVSFSSGSVLAADGRGTNVLTKMNGGAYTISAETSSPQAEVIVEYVAPANTPAAPVISSATHPKDTTWYKETTAELSWKLPSGVTAMRTLLDERSTGVPTKVYDTPQSSITLSDLKGVQYFHLQFKNEDGWGKVEHYRLAVDAQKPTSFDIALAEGNDVSNPVQTLAFKTVDGESKVKRFLVKIDASDAYEFIDEKASGTHSLLPLEPGRHTTIVEAFDEAGNSIVSSFSFDILAFEKPRFTEFPYEINEQVIPVIKGTTKPKATVEVSMTRMGLGGVSEALAVVTKQVNANDAGEFIFIPDGKLTLGVYELTAFATDQYGARSEVSDPITIAVQQPGYMKIGSLLINVLSVVIPLIALCALLVLGAWFMLMRLRLLKRGVSREAKEAHKILDEEFRKMKAIIQDERGILEESQKPKTSSLLHLKKPLFPQKNVYKKKLLTSRVW